MGQDKVHVSILQFPDDTPLFCKYDDDMLDIIIQTIEFLEWCLSQKVNCEKPALHGINVG